MSTKEFIKKNFILGLILTSALLLRAIGINYNLPLSTSIGDEIVILSGSLRMLAEKTLTLSFAHSNYFPLPYYLYIPFLLVYVFFLKFFTPIDTIEKIKELGILHTGNFLIVGRIISVLSGAASVFLIYLISQKLFNKKRISLIASLIFAISPLNVLMSHFARPWSIQIFFILLAVYYALRIFKKDASQVSYGQIIALGILSGLSFAANTIGILVYTPILALIYFSFGVDRWRNFFSFLKSRKFLYFNLLIILFIIAAYFLNRTSFINSLSGFVGNVFEGQNIFAVSFSEKLIYYFKILFKYETALFFLPFPAFYFLFKKSKKAFWFLLVGFLTYFIFLGPLGGFTQARFTLPMTPFLILASAYCIDYFWSLKGRNFGIPLLIISILPGLFLSTKLDIVLSNNGTDISAYNWMQNNITAGSRILFVNNYFLQDLIPTKKSIMEIKKYTPEFFSSRMAYLLDKPDSDYPQPAYGIYQDTIICDWPKKEIEKMKFDHVFISEGISKETTDKKEINLCSGFIRINLDRGKLIYESKEGTFLGSYQNQGGDPILETLEYFTKIKKLGSKTLIYHFNQP